MQIKCSYKELWKQDALKPHPSNPNTHPKNQIEFFKEVIRFNGIRRPITVSKRSGYITKGHGLFIALSEMGIEEFPVDIQDYESEEHELADIVADNQLTKMAVMEYEKLRPIVKKLDQNLISPSTIGFSSEQMQALLGEINVAPKMFEAKPSVLLPPEYYKPPQDPNDRPENETQDLADKVLDANEIKNQVKFGDVWRLGDHILVCGDALEPKSYQKKQSQPRLLISDPPYGVEYEGSAEDSINSIKNDDRAEWQQAYENTGAQIAYIWHAATKADVFRTSLEKAGFQIRQEIVWVKPSAAFGRSHYHWRHEPCFYCVKEGMDANWIGTRNQNTVWEARSPLKGENGAEDARSIHPTQKPVILYEIPILNHTFEGEVVIDCFSGSGTIFIACERTKRKAYGIEFDPVFCNQIIARWEKFSGKTAEKIGTL